MFDGTRAKDVSGTQRGRILTPSVCEQRRGTYRQAAAERVAGAVTHPHVHASDVQQMGDDSETEKVLAGPAKPQRGGVLSGDRRENNR